MFRNKEIIFIFLISVLGCSNQHAPSLWQRTHDKIHKILTVDIRYKALDQEHEKLKKEYFELEHRYTELLAQTTSAHKAEQNLKLTGAKDGRHLASIAYEVPADLSMDDRYNLALSHMKDNQFAQAAKTFETFLWIPDGAYYQTPKNFYEAGVAWFKIENFKKAKECFAASRARFESINAEEKMELEKRIDLWMRILEQHQ